MKSKFSYKSKRTIIIAAIITVLLAGTATGVYFFTKGNAQAQAAGDNNTTQEQYGEAPEENKNEQQNNTTENEQNKNEQGETTPNQQEEQETERQEQTTNNNQTTQNEQTTTTTTGEVPNQEYVTEREETVKNPWESLEVGWGPTQFASIASTANLTVKKSNLEIHKTVDKESVKIGDTLTYTISVKNNGDKVAKAIIYDNVPEGTVLLNKDNNEDENTKKSTWRVTVEPGETEKVEFTVRVKAEKGTIKNSAIVNGKTTNETETGIINITGKKEVNTSEAKVGDTLTYTITLTNSGNATGTVTVTDEIPAGTTLVEKSITNNGVESNGTITWTDVEVKAGDTVEVSFKVTINSDTKTSVTNKAVIDGNKPTEEVETKVANITGAKSVDKSTAKVGDTLTYTITLTNSGNADGKVTVTDEIPTGTTLVADSITANGSYNEENKTITWTDVKVEAGKTAEVSFKVTINSDTKTSVTNKAVIDGNKPTEEVETKVANITGAKSVDKSTAKVGDTLTYTITLTNSGNADGMVTVTDEIPTGTRIKDENTTGYNKATNTMIWSDVEVKAGKSVELTLEVVVEDNTSVIKNKAYVDDNKILEEPETAVKHHYTVEHYTENLDGTYSKVEKDTVVSEDVEIGTKVTYEANKYDGFTFDDSKTENKDATVPDNNNLVVKLYYTRRNDLNYTVYYKEQGTETKLAEAKVVNNKTFEEVITASIKAEDNATEKPKTIDGYECVEVKPGELSIGTGENVITFYYVKLCQYKIEYYLNGNLAEQYTVGPEKIRVGTTIGFETKTEELEKIDSAISGYKYIKYVGVDGKDNEGTTAYKDMNVIKVYYGLPVTSIEKTATEFVNAGDEIEYTIEVSNTGDWKTTITVTDTLEETEYVNGSSNITPSIDGKTLSWSIELEARGSKTISFRAKTNNESYGDEISNTAKIKGTNKEDTAVTRVNEIDVTYSEWLEGQKGTDLNIVFVLDNSSSMNFPIAGKTYVKDELNRKGSHVTPIAPSDKDKTRIENAKSAINSFIDSQANNENTTMEVVTFNKSEKGTAKNMMTLMDIPDKDIQYRENLWGGYYYIEINGIECRVEKDVIGTDGKKHCGVYIPIDYGARLVGDNSVSNDILKKNVSEISISSEQNGFGTYVEPAFKLINDNKEKQYLKDGKKNIIIVLADGKFSDNNSYNGELKTLKDTLETNGGEIYCVGFGSGTEYDSTALAKMSTNNKCYEAKDASTLLTKFNEILASVGKTQSGRTQNGKITFEEAKNTIKVSEECPIVATYGDSENETVLFTCTSDNADEMWNKYGLKIDGKIISWDAKQFAIANEGIKVPNNIKIKYYIARQ